MDAIVAQLIRNSLFYASEEMGIALRNASYSPNIKERMDHSAAIFDPEGRLLAQAEHIPVHLGSLPWGLKNILDYSKRRAVAIEDGSMIMANNPYIAGTHLNDVTVVRPIYHSERLVGYAANKAHHSDVGGKVPGSISTDARTLQEEGVIIDPRHLMRRNEFINEAVTLLATNSRTPAERKGDLKAQAAANFTGERRVQEVVSKYGIEVYHQACIESIDYAERLARKRISQIKAGKYHAEDYLEDPNGTDIRLKIAISITESEIRVDYEGTDKQVDNPLNAVFGVTLSGVYYVIRTITGDDIPANHGAFSPTLVRAPEGTIVNPTYPHPVAGGNVETSQRNADLVYKALAKSAFRLVPAAAGGSMNNLMMGGTHLGKTWAFYETIGVGLGGRSRLDGIDGIQANMTNTMNTPIEEIERTMPLMVKQYEFRPNSGGSGKYRGGSGIIRSFQALDHMTFTVLSDRGRHAPWGLFGGSNGEKTRVKLHRALLGRNSLKEGRAKTTTLPVKTSLLLNPGDTVEIQTAGGGGYGDPKDRDPLRGVDDVENGIITPDQIRSTQARKHPIPRTSRIRKSRFQAGPMNP